MADNEFQYKLTIDDDEALAAFGRIAKKAEQTAKEAKTALGKIDINKQAKEVEKAFALIQKSGSYNIRQLSKDELELRKAMELLGSTGQFELNKIGKEAKKTSSTFDTLKANALKIGAAIGVLVGAAKIVDKFTDAAIEADKAIINLNISANAAAREFGTVVGTSETWQRTVKQLRGELKIYSEQELANATTRLIDMSKRLGLTEDQMIEVLRRTAALSAGKVDLQGGIERVTSALRGEAESAEYLGLALNENSVKAYAESQGLVWKNLSDTEKAQQRYGLLLEQTNEIQDRAAQYANTLAGKEEALNAKLKDQAVTIGEQLLPLREGYTEFLGLLTTETEDSASRLGKAQAAIAAFFIALGAVVVATTKNTIEGLKAMGSAATNTVEAIKQFRNPLDAVQGDIERFNKAVSDNQAISFEQAYQDAFEQVLEGWKQQRDAAKQASDDVSNLPFKIGGETEITVDTEEVQKALDKLSDLERDAARDRIDILRKADQKMVDAEVEAQEKRIDQARKFLQELEDIERKNAQAITDSATDLRRDEEDAQRDYSRKRLDIEKDQAKKAIEIEEDYQQEIRDIQDRFNIDADEAARNRDAVTFLRLQRQRDRELEEARQTRDEKLADNVAEGEEKRQQLKQELEYELEDARIADERRLEDLKLRLEREIEEAKLKNERELEELAINEFRKQAEIEKSLEIQLNEAEIANDRRVQDYKDSLDEEIAALVEAEEKKTEILKEQIKKRNELDRQLEEEKSQENSRLGGRQFGGPVGSGQAVTVGERGPEIFVPSVAGDIVPLQPGITSPLAARNITSTINNIQNASVNQSFGANQDAISAQIARNAALETIRQILAR